MLFTLLCHFCLVWGHALLLGRDYSAQIESIKQLYDLENFSEAEKSAESLLELIEKNSDKIKIFEILSTLSNRGKFYKKSAGYLLRAREIADEDEKKNRYTFCMADLYYLNGEYSLAASLYLDRFLSSADDEVLFRYVCSLLKSGRFQEALDLPFSFQKKSVELRSAWNVATTLVNAGEKQKVVQYLEKFLTNEDYREEKLFSKILNLVAMIFSGRGEYLEALRLIDLFPIQRGNFMDSAYYDILYLKAKILFNVGEINIADNTIDIIRREAPSRLEKSLLMRAAVLIEQRQFEQAYKGLMHENFKENIDEANYLKGKALVFLGEGGEQRALEIFSDLNGKNVRMKILSKIEQGRLLKRRNEFRKAESLYSGLLQEVSDDGELKSYILLQKAKCLIAEKERLDEAENLLETVLYNERLLLEMRLEAQYAILRLRANRLLQKSDTNEDEQPLLEKIKDGKYGPIAEYWFRKCQNLLAEFS